MRSVKTRTNDVISARPNWTSPVTETHEFRTTITTSRDGSEQRAALRQTPRLRVEFSADQFDYSARRLMIDASRFPTDSTFVLPSRTRKVTLDGDHGAGVLMLHFSGDTPWWLAEGQRLVVETDTQEEALAVTLVGAGEIIIAEATTFDLTDGAAIYLAYDARFAAKTTQRSQVSSHRGGPLSFEVDPGSVPEVLPTHEVLASHEGYAVFLEKPDWRKVPATQIHDLREMIDPGYGRVEATAHPADRTLRETLTFTEITQASVDALLGFFTRCRGQQACFWLPSGRDDLELASQSDAATSTLLVDGLDVSLLFGSRVHTTVMVTWPDGRMQLNRIDGMALAGANTLLTVRDEWARDVTSAERIEWAFLARFATDNFETKWLTDSVAEMSLPFHILANTFIDQPVTGRKLNTDPPGSGTSQSYADPETWTEFNVALEGIPPRAVAEGKVTCSAYWEGEMRDQGGTVSMTLQLSVAFFADGEVEAVSPDGGIAQNVNFIKIRPAGETAWHTAELPPLTVALTATSIRFRYYRSFPCDDVFQYCTVTSPDWGFEAEKGLCL